MHLTDAFLYSYLIRYSTEGLIISCFGLILKYFMVLLYD